MSRAAIIAVAAAAIGGCSSDVGRFGSDPYYTGSTPNQRAILGGEAAAYGGHAYAGQAAAPVRPPERNWSNVDTTGSIDTGGADVYRRDLTPPPPPSSGPYAETVARPLADATRPAEPEPEYPRVASAGGWTSTGGTYVTLRNGETIDTLSGRYGVPVAAIRQTNNYAPGRTPQAGDRVLIPVYSAPTAAAPAAAPVAAPPRPAAAPVRQISMAKPTPTPAPTPVVHQSAQPMPPQAMPPQRPTTVATAPGPRPLAVPTTTGSVPPATKPVAVAPKPAAAAPQTASAPQSTGGVKLVGTYTVRSGDTLSSIASTYGVSEQALRERNNLRSSALSPGQQILLPAGTKLMLKTSKAPEAKAPEAKTPEAKPTVVAKADTPPAKPTATSPSVVTVPKPTTAKGGDRNTDKIDQKAAETIAVAREPSPAEDDKAQSGGGSFRWPVRGRIISEYGSKPNGEKNEGINLAVPEGTSVKAADGGEVIYSGNELKGYGNLVLVRHPNGFVSAYAHASELLVNRGDKVSRGQIIARAGSTGSVTQPQLHFELRKGQRAVDPKPYLASN